MNVHFSFGHKMSPLQKIKFMSQLDAKQFPIVKVIIQSVNEGHDQDQYFNDYEALLKTGKKFVMINEVSAPDVKDTKSNKDHMKKMNLWVKKNREQLRNNVLAMIQVEPNEEKRQVAIDFKEIFFKYWGHELFVVSTAEEALVLANEKLLIVNK